MTTHVYMNRTMKGITVSRHYNPNGEKIGELPIKWPFSERGWSEQNYEPWLFLSELRKTTRGMNKDSLVWQKTAEVVKGLPDYFPGFSPGIEWLDLDIEPNMGKEVFYKTLLSKDAATSLP